MRRDGFGEQLLSGEIVGETSEPEGGEPTPAASTSWVGGRCGTIGLCSSESVDRRV